ncbi:MAG: Rne/Rng family ribonuclease [Janthinobacterium lividum]
MTKRMLIASTNAEETRVVVLDGNRLDEFDLETSTKHQLKGNIYLAKVVRVEPSLQAAFVEYGGNRHGFLAFGEIHPDYYQIPVADRKRLLEAQEQEAREDEEAEDRAAAAQNRRPRQSETPADTLVSDAVPGDEGASETATAVSADSDNVESAPAELTAASNDHPTEIDSDGGEEIQVEVVPTQERVEIAEPSEIVADLIVAPDEAVMSFTDEAQPAQEGEVQASEIQASETGSFSETSETADDAPAPEQIGGEHDTDDQDRRSTPRFLKHYKIQEVIRRRQVLLIQVVKEERGSKGAALTTYISLAGRFSVLMPNSPRGGGISRKITSASDRRRLKEVTAELDLPRGMGLIVRTAGANRPKPEILRDCEYLLNQWDQIRELTMKSIAPTLIYEEASLIKRAIRDVYSRDVDDILVDGEAGWRAARDFMRMLMPTHAKKVQLWKDPTPLFAKAQVEQQLEGMLQPTVQLRSGGYLVINQTEALVAIDVNSGRSTRERGIEETALRTNLEAAEETARQLRLRDLAGLIVIDFIDMESRRNVAAVERKLKDALKFDRARIQVGGISHFGLLEMSRQRLRPSLTEANFAICTHCGGTGHMRTSESAALVALRAIEEEGGRRRAAEIVVYAASSIALYILNHKRQRLTDIENRHSMLVSFVADETLMPPELRIEKVRAQTASELPVPIQQLAPPEPFEDPDEIEAVSDADIEDDDEETAEAADGTQGASEPSASSSADSAEKRGRRRRRRRGSRREDGVAASAEAGDESGDESGAEMGDETGAENGEEIGDTIGAETGVDGAGADRDVASDVVGAGSGETIEGEAGETAPASAVTDASATDAGETASTEASALGDAEEGERRRRGRRGGRRRRRDGSESEANAAPSEATPDVEPYVAPAAPAPTMPVYAGPTPANPFAGASAFDIFDAIEQAEEQRLLQPKQRPDPVVTEPEPAAVAEPELDLEPAIVATVEPMAAAEPEPEPAPSAPEAVTPSSVQEPVTAPSAPEPVTAGPAIQPVVIGATTEPSEKKRGWWRR